MPLPGPDTRVVELRVPGTSETTGESLLDATDTVQVAGDRQGRFVRPADRLHRPSPGPVLRAPGQSVPRNLEGYLWNRVFRGALAKALWAALFPFTLANLAHWMLPAATAGHPVERALGTTCRALLRLAAALLTVLLVSQTAVLSLELFAGQCLAADSGCLPAAPDWLRTSTGWRTAVGLLPVAVVIALLCRAAGYGGGDTVHDTDEVDETVGGDSDRDQPALGDGPRPAHNIATLGCLHTVAALGALGVLLTGGPLGVPAGTAELVCWVCALVLVTAALLGTLPSPARLGGRVGRGALLACGVAVALACAVFAGPLRAGDDTGAATAAPATTLAIGAVLAALCVLFAVLLVPLALLTRRHRRGQPKRLRPWAGGWVAAPVLVLACLLGGGFGAAVALGTRALTGTAQLWLPHWYTLLTALWGAALVLAAAQALVVVVFGLLTRGPRGAIPEVVRLLHPNEREWSAAATAWSKASCAHRWPHRFALALMVVLAACALAFAASTFTRGDVPVWLTPASGVGVLALALVAVGLLRMLADATGTARGTGCPAALGAAVAFWPPVAHPAAGRGYATKAVDDLNARAREHLTETDTRVVLTGCGSGGVLATIAAARLAATATPAQRERIGLVTAGCPLQAGYQRAFPGVFGLESLAGLYSGLQQRWRGLCRGTDPFGGGVTTWRHQVVDGTLLGMGYLPDGSTGALPAGTQATNGAVTLGGDHWLPDPLPEPREGYRWSPGVRAVADYVSEPEWDHAVTLAAGLRRADATPSPSAEQTSLLADVLNNRTPSRAPEAADGVSFAAARGAHEKQDGGTG